MALSTRLLSSGLKDGCLTSYLWKELKPSSSKVLTCIWFPSCLLPHLDSSGNSQVAAQLPQKPPRVQIPWGPWIHGTKTFKHQTLPHSLKLLTVLLQADARLAQNEILNLDKGVLTWPSKPILLDMFWVSLGQKVASCVLLIGVLEWGVGWSFCFRARFFSFFLPYLKADATV